MSDDVSPCEPEPWRRRLFERMRQRPTKANLSRLQVGFDVSVAAQDDGTGALRTVEAQVDATGLAEGTVKHHRRWLVQGGWLYVAERGRGEGVATVYWLTVPNSDGA